MKQPTLPTHGGAVVLRMRGGQTEVLVVRSSDRTAWVLPKGHIEPGETAADAAAREVREEAGVAANVERALTLRPIPAKTALVAYFLAWETGEVQPTEMREKRWLGVEEALNTLSFSDAKESVKEAVGKVA